jgi:hypothetical protein
MVERAMSRKVGWMTRTDGMASSVAGSNSYGLFPVGTREGAYLYCPLLAIEDVMARFKAAVTVVDANLLKVRLKECCALHCSLP